MNKGLSLLEVLLAAVIFAVSVAGVYATINAVRVPVLNAQNRLIAANFSKQALQALYSRVDSASYYTNTCAGGMGPSSQFDLSPCWHSINNNGPLAAVGLTWPKALLAAPCDPNPQNHSLDYNVTCSDGTTQAACFASTATRVVSISIPWPDLQTNTC